MAKFCTKCGKELKEGKICDCNKLSKNIKNNQIDLKESSIDCLNVFKKIFTKPFEAIKEFVCDNKFIAGIIMIVVAALTTGIYKIATLKSMYSASSASSFNTSDLSSLFGSLSNGLSVSEPEYLKEFFTTFATNLVEYALIVMIGYLIISKLLKGKTTWKYMVTAVALSLSVVLVGNLLNSLLAFIDGDFIGNIRSYISSIAYIFSILALYESVKEISGINKDRLFVAVASMSVFATVIIDVFQKLFN